MAEATRLARSVIGGLIEAGVRELVLSPGSRSAPLAYAAYDADAAGLLRLHVRIDERGAGFLALGLARASGTPVAVLTTSGTAAANLYPAVLEACYAHVPLIALTASRPRGLIHTGANQTADQEQLFGRHVVASATLSDVVADDPTWRYEVARLAAAATGRRSRRPGPVQLNVELGEPLVPDQPPAPFDGLRAAPDTLRAAPARLGAPAPVATTVTRLTAGPRTAIVAGDLPPDQGRELAGAANAAGIPILAEPSSNARHGPAAIGLYRLLLAGPLADRIERVVVVGHPTLSRPVSRLLARSDREIIVVSPYADWPDPGRTATQVVDAVQLAPGDQDWLADWRAADHDLRVRLDRLLGSLDHLSGPAVAAGLWTSSSADVLFAGSSNPIRDLDLAPVTADPPEVYANRGLSGIDGSISTAMGIALAAGRPTHALLGDLTALHDLNALALGPDEPRPDLRIVIANDDGGSIFATLEYGSSAHAGSFERLFATPHGTTFAAAAKAFSHRFTRVRTSAELASALAAPPHGIEIVEAVVDRAQRRELLGPLAITWAPPC